MWTRQNNVRAVAHITAAFMGMVLLALPAGAKKFEAPPMPAGYDDPGALPEDLLGALVGELKIFLKDPYSVRDFSLCQTNKLNAMPALSRNIPWRRAYWVVHFKLNAKNAYGGYTGLQAGIASYQEGRFARISLIGPPINEGPPKAAREPCTQFSDEHIQKLMAAG